MNKQIKHTYGGMTKDISKSRFPNTSYYDASAFRVTASEGQSTYSLANEKGTNVQITFPDYTVNSTHLIVPVSNYTVSIPYNVNDIPLGTHKDHKLVGSINVKDGIVFFTTGTIDTIWLYKFDNENHIQLLYARDLGFSQDNQITGISNYENEKIEKIYWVDGLHQIRHLNIRHSIANGDYEELINIPTDNIEMVSKFKMSQPIIKDITTGGNHTAGIIQYAYVLYRLNGNTSNVSALSKQVPLTNGSNGGGGINEIVNTVPIIRIEDLDENYTNIIIYSIKYTSYGVPPEVSIIYDQRIPENRNVELFDDGSILSSITLEEFVLKIQDIKIPEHLTSKDNRLFVANYEEKTFNVNLDVRAYSFDNIDPNIAISKVYSDVESLDNLNNIPSRTITPNNFPDDPDDTFDNINLDFDTYKYSLSSINIGNTLTPTIGGTSKYLTYEIVPDTGYDSRNKYFKDEEIYRLGIEFYNEYGISTKPMWIADFKAPQGNFTGYRNTLKFTWKQAFYDWYNSQNFDEYNKPVGYKLLIAERNADDRTIITGGLASTMTFNFGNHIDIDYSEYGTSSAIDDRGKNVPKMPSFLIRNMTSGAWNSPLNITRPLRKIQHNLPLEIIPSSAANSDSESARGPSILGNRARFLNAQFTKMIQIFSPDTVFNQNLNITGGLNLKVKGLLRNTRNEVWGQEVKVDGNVLVSDGTGVGISLIYADDVQMTEGVETSIHDTGLISHPGGSDANEYMRTLWYRTYGNTFIPNSNPFNYQQVLDDNIFDIYGKAEYAMRGQSFSSYNKDSEFRYINSLVSFKSFPDPQDRDDMGIYNRRIVSINADATGNITVVPVDSNNNFLKLEDICNEVSVDGEKINNYVPYIEFIKSREEIYLGGIYGGNSYEDKLRTKYLSIGEYNDLSTSSIHIESPGDTFIQNFRFLRICRTDENIINQGTYQMEEIVEFPVETSIDLENRNDVSTSDWNSKISYSFDEYHKYNRVYSQPDNLRVNINNEYFVKDVDSYETNVIASKLKTPGELIDSWLDLSPNEQIALDGKFGPITNLLYLNDEIYTLQDRSFSKLSINPRVQVQGGDGVSIELGSGQVLQDYQYITTDIGCKNKHGSIVTPYGIYFYDSNNKRLNLYNGQITPLSETAGLHSYLYNKNLNNIDLDKPLKGTGLSLGYDYINNDVYFSFLTNNEDAFTLRYTEKGNLFMDDNKYLVNHYAGFGDKFYGNLSDNKIHQFGKGDYNNYFGTVIPSKVTLIVNPEVDLSVIVNNIMFKSEAYLDGIDQPNITLTHIRAYNEYQDSGLVPLVNNRRGNIQRLFREWNAQVPRVAGTRERIRNPWTYLELTFNNPNNYKFILHDMNISYSV